MNLIASNITCSGCRVSGKSRIIFKKCLKCKLVSFNWDFFLSSTCRPSVNKNPYSECSVLLEPTVKKFGATVNFYV